MSSRRRIVWRRLLLTCLLTTTTGVAGEESRTFNAKDSWYTRYPRYPEYCSTPTQMDQRSIPPLDPMDEATQLVHVTVITRHGTRTIAEGPSEQNYQCWKDFWTNEETGIWDCALKSMVMPPSPERVMEEEESNQQPSETELELPNTMFFFTTIYDALKNGQSNTLNGTCQIGQLLLQGYEQQVKNGEILREAYLSEYGTESLNSALQLFQVGGADSQEPWSDDRQLYLRSADSQATLVSGELVMRGLFEKELIQWRKTKRNEMNMNSLAFPTIAVHTTDHSRDILGGFREGCQALTRLQSASDNSWEYQEFMESKETKDVLRYLEMNLRNEPGILDCLMTTVCTDRPLPDGIGIYNPRPDIWFDRISTYFVKNHSFHLTYNDGEFSKLSMGPLWSEIMDHIMPVIKSQVGDTSRPPAKLAVYSGYDSTIMEILASLGAWDSREWPPYGSMVVLEIHEILDWSSESEGVFSSPYAFRLLYNGEVITAKINGCKRKHELCDSRHLLDRVLPFAKRNVDCVDVNLEKPDAVHLATELMADTAGIILLFVIVASSALIGSMAVLYCLTGSMATKEIKSIINDKQAHDVFSDELMDT